MLKTIIKHSLRSFNRQKGYFFINLLGLSLGIASSLLISTYVFHEFSYDRFNEKSDRIYKLILNGKIGEQEVLVTSTASVIAPTMHRDFPQIEEFCRINARGITNLRYNDQNFEERSYIEADSSFFRVFTAPLIHGNTDEVLNKPYTVVISQSLAKKIFGDEDPLNKRIQLGTDTEYFTISGVMEDLPETCHFSANIISSFMTNPRSREGAWLNNSFDTYFLLHKNSSPESVEELIPPMIIANVGPQIEQFFGATFEEFLSTGNKYEFYLQPLLKVHFDPSIDQPFKQATDPLYLIVFGSVALLIIIIAAINFMNLSTAQASRRAREVGMKKVAGSTKRMLVSQFLSESVILALFSLIVAILIVKLSLPWFNDLLNASFDLELLGSWFTIPILILLALAIGILSGSYPAFYLSSASPLEAFKSQRSLRSGNGRLRSILVVIQFTASIMLIIGTAIMYRQINYMLNKDVGYNKEQMLVISSAGSLGDRSEAFKERVSEISGVRDISAATAVPNRNNNNNGYMLEGKLDNTLLLTTSWVDYDFIRTYQMEMLEGRFFDPDFPADIECCVLNEAAIKEYSIDDISSTRIMTPQDNGEFGYMNIIGVVKDFNHESLQRRIAPYIMRFRTVDFQFGYISIRLEEGDIMETSRQIEEIWKEFTNTESMPSFFMDEDFSRIYRQEKQSATLTVIFALFAIIVATLGLFGLTSFMLQQRTKEIGIRKAMGSSAKGIFALVSKEILLLVTIATIIGSPIIYFIASKWLQNYHFKIDISIMEFILGYLISVLIALATVSYRILKAARANPTNSLRYD